jgi:peptidase M50B-like protein
VTARFLRVVLFGLVFLLLMVNVHEVGHTVFARLLGDGSAHYVLYQQRGSSTCMGCNLYDSSRLENVANALVNLGGVIFTQLLGWSAILLLARGRPAAPRWLLLTAIVITWSGDVILQLVQGLLANVPQELPRGPERTYTDYLAVVWFLRNQTGADASDLKIGLLIGTIVYSTLLVLATRWALERNHRLTHV